MPSIHPSIIHASAPVELSPVSPPWEGCSTSFASDAKAFHHFWQEIGRNLQSFHLRENKKTVQISPLISKKGKQEVRCPKSPPIASLLHRNVKFIHSTSPNKLDGIDFCYNFCSLKRYQLRLENHGLNGGDAALAIALKGVILGIADGHHPGHPTGSFRMISPEAGGRWTTQSNLPRKGL